MLQTKDIWNRAGKDVLPIRVYALVLGLCLLWSVFLVSVGASFTYDLGPQFFISFLSFIGALFGIVLFSKSAKPVPSFVGVSILSVFLGASIGPILAYYSLENIVSSLTFTFVIIFFMVVAGTLFPNFIKKAGGVIFIGLLVLTFGYFMEFLLTAPEVRFTFSFLDWLAVFIFSAYIWYDWSKAMGLPKTLTNAIDASGSLILDIVNLFLSLLRIFSRRG